MTAVLSAVFLAQAALTAPGDLVIPRKDSADSDDISPSVFPHWLHRTRYRCDSCHPRLFEMKLGASEISMDLIRKGESCGACHNGQQAFAVSFTNCARCHVSPEN
jgi:c(7)-type cytochrome triheme protein